MENTALLERPEALPTSWVASLQTAPRSPVEGLMLHKLCTLSHRTRFIIVRDVLSRQDLDLRDWIVLSTLYEHGAATQRDITRASTLDKVAVNRASARLKGRKLVTSRPHACDGRSHVLEVSDLGRQTVTACSRDLAEFERDALSRFNEGERRELNRLLERLVETLETII